MCVLSVYLYWVHIDHRFTTVTAGQVYRSGDMPVQKLKEKIQSYGIRTVVDFRKQKYRESIEAESRTLTGMGVKYVHLPTRQAPDEKTVRAFLSVMDNPDNRPVLIHCHHGTGRAVLFSAIYRIEYEGWPNERARQDTRLVFWGSDFSLDGRKGRFLHEYKPLTRHVNE